jgi:glutathione synthase
MGEFEKDSSYLKSFELCSNSMISLDQNSVLHMRLDPPFDSRYLRFLWILRGLKEKYGVRVINDPEGIAIHNEKMVSYELSDAVETFVGSSKLSFEIFLNNLKNMQASKYEGLILKPLDLYQGIGVERVEKNLSSVEVINLFEKKREEYGGPVVAQPFMTEVFEGEIRAIFFNGKELGSILKTPPKGEFLANIARGAKYEKVKLSDKIEKECRELSLKLSKKGVPWLAYDILGEKIQEANLTCPGLMVEVSKAMGKNLAFDLVDQMENFLKEGNSQ